MADRLSDTGMKAFACPKCPLVSSRKDVILRHFRNFHGRCGSGDTGSRLTDADGNGTEGDGDCVVVCATTTTTTAAAADDTTIKQKDKNESRPRAMTVSDVPGTVADDQASCNMDSVFDQHLYQDFDAMDFNFVSSSHPNPPESIMTDRISSHSSSYDFNMLLTPEDNEGASMSTMPIMTSLGSASDCPAGEQFANMELALGANDIPRPENPGLSMPSQLLTLAEYEGLKSVFHSCSKQARRFPSRSMAAGFLRAFFVHLEPHCPIVHRPTFSSSTTKRMPFHSMFVAQNYPEI